MSESSFATTSIPKFGYVPVNFPRDIVKVNTFPEHILLGQILEPLVDADRFGSITRGVAESWIISPDGKSITFKIASGQVFSNGQAISSKDVKYSLDRHLNEKTQSSNFLKAVKDVTTNGNDEVVVKLNEPNVAILKALTRDHLGVVPAEWKFDSNLDEPIVGSGAYRLIRKHSKWYLTKNSRNLKSSSDAISDWELVFFKNEKMEIPDGEIPDYVPMATQEVFKDLKAISDKKHIPLEVKEQLSFAQTSMWWHPHGRNFRSNEIKKRTMRFLDELVGLKAHEAKFQRATGIVPVGVAGSLQDPVKFEASIPATDNTEKTKISIAGLGPNFDFMFKGSEAKTLATKYGLEIDFYNFTALELDTLKTKKPDVVMAAWAGGFNDPEGFLPLLNVILGVDFVEYLENLRPLYQSARIEQDWTKRTELFKQFNEKLVREMRMVPGWKIEMYSLAKHGLTEEKVGFRYTPRLINVKRTN